MTVSELKVSNSPGWYRDPWGRYEYRWWDGSDWTGRVSTRDRVLEEALDAKAAPSLLARRRTILSVVSLAVIVLAGFVAYFVFVRTGAEDASEERSIPLRGAAAEPFTLRTCQDAEGDGCPVQITLRQIDCGIAHLPDVEGGVDPDYNPTETIAPDSGPESGQFCAVEYDVENTGTATLASVAVHVKLVDDAGATHVQADDSSSRAAAVRLRYEVRDAARVIPDAIVSEAAVFDLPRAAAPASLVFTGGLDADRVEVRLE